MDAFKLLLQPPPQSFSLGEEQQNLLVQAECIVDSHFAEAPFFKKFEKTLQSEFGIKVVSAETTNDSWELQICVENSPKLTKPESYCLEIELGEVSIVAADERGVFYGLQTLIQLFHIASQCTKEADGKGLFVVPSLTIQDFPSFQYRGVMLDISRDKVYTLETAKQIVDLLAHFKYNQLQLYMEHTFAYVGHEEVWKDSSPFTPAEILELHQYCKDQFVELVPNQNSFGHMHRWLSHEKYKKLAETPEGILHGFNNKVEPYSICPTLPESIDFLKDLYSQLLPNFPGATQFNVGLDETFDLGKGQSKAECEAKGVEVVYLEFLQKIHALIKKEFPHVKMQFWGDIILHRPDLIPQLPKDIIALDWGYESDHPFAKSTKHFAESGIPFYVCPGTSSWNSIGGRVENCYGNLQNAAENGFKNGAIGYLVTDWGDHGHWQQLPISFFGFVAGAGFGWNVKESLAISMADGVQRAGHLLDLHIFKSSGLGQTLLDLGNSYLSTKCLIGNQTSIFRMILFPNDHPTLTAKQRPSSQNLENTEKMLKNAKERFLGLQKANREDKDIISEELDFTFDLLIFGCHFGRVYARNVWEQGKEDIPVANLPTEDKQVLYSSLEGLIKRFEACWHRRNKPGGLRESVGRLQSLLVQLK
eukprot:Phypoly_transcript_04619.p1 GENE.Phypoly_transcript_04619~~Phypoly_transcript_04619.p1  ORF type:complete len:668 (+),score=98.58 Phypoly_transcript_04619:66-2006(+)